MSTNQALFPVAAMTRVLGVSPAGYYAWRDRPPSAHAQVDATLLKRVRSVHANSRQIYGAPRVHAQLGMEGARHGRKRIARLMREAGLVGASHRQGGPMTTRRDPEARPTPDLVDRDFTAERANQLWVADITYVPTAAGFLYLAVVLDVWSRKIVGWSMANHLRTELVLDALEMAVGQRRPRDVIHHPTRAPNTPRSCSAAAVAKPVCGPRWGRLVTHTTTPCARASSPRWSVNCWPGGGSLRRQRPKSPASATSRAGTIRSACTPRLDTGHPLLTNSSILKRSLWKRNYPTPQTVHQGGSTPPKPRALARLSHLARELNQL
jgi:hypothetical protein